MSRSPSSVAWTATRLLETAGPPPEPPLERAGGPARTAVVGVLTAVAVLLVPLSVLTGWVHETVTSTERYLELVGPVVDDPAVQRAVTEQVADSLTEQLPLDRLPGSVESGVAQLITGRVEEAVGSDAFARAWVAAHRVGHEQLMGVLSGSGTSAVVLDGDVVRIDGAEVLREVERGLDAVGLDVDLPDVEVGVPLLEDAAVGDARQGYDVLSAAARWLPVAGALAAALAVGGARDRRRHLARLATATAAALIVVGGAVLVGSAVVGDLGAGDELAVAVESVLVDRAVAALRGSIGISVGVAALVAVATWAGAPGRFRSSSSRKRRCDLHRNGL